jgi:hypothetical protein
MRIKMLSSRRGAWWYMDTLCRILNRQKPDSDGEYFIGKNYIIKQSSCLKGLRKFYAACLLVDRKDRKLEEIGSLHKLMKSHDFMGTMNISISRPCYQRLHSLRSQITAIERRLEKLPNPWLQPFL